MQVFFLIFYAQTLKRKIQKTIHDPKYEYIIKKLKERRRELGISQQAVGEKFGRYQSFVSKLESGERRLDIIELLKLSEIYKTDINFFVPKKKK